MTRQVFSNVEPIRPGYEATITITSFPQSFWDALEMGTGRLVAQFRRNMGGTVLYEADTLGGSIERVGATGLTITVPAESTTDFIDHALFDLVRIDGAERRPIPGLWQWPVRRTVTRDVS